LAQHCDTRNYSIFWQAISVSLPKQLHFFGGARENESSHSSSAFTDIDLCAPNISLPKKFHELGFGRLPRNDAYTDAGFNSPLVSGASRRPAKGDAPRDGQVSGGQQQDHETDP